jgi:type I restriction enzyme S subunit
MNKTLEATARAIFKDWFVDFGPTRAKQEGHAAYLVPEIWSLFPHRLDAEGKPEGWEIKRLDTGFDVRIGRTPPRKETQHFVSSSSGRPWLSIKTMGELQVFAFRSEEDLTEGAVASFRVPLIKAETVIVSFKLTVGRVAIAANDMHSNEAIANLVPNSQSSPGPEYTYFFMKAFDYNKLGSTSSIATAVNSDSIRSIKMLFPLAQSVAGFNRVVSPALQRIKLNCGENRTLAQTRDFLLPKLMSGEVRVKDAEKIVGEAT